MKMVWRWVVAVVAGYAIGIAGWCLSPGTKSSGTPAEDMGYCLTVLAVWCAFLGVAYYFADKARTARQKRRRQPDTH